MRRRHQRRGAEATPNGRCDRPVVCALVCGVLALLFLASLPQSFAQPQATRPAVKRAAPAKLADADDDPGAALAEQRFPGGAALKTDPEQQRLLARAEQCVQENRLDLAVVLWQKVLDEAGDTLMTRDGRTYTSLAEHVERTLARLPKLALDTYRTSADGEAQALLAAAGSEGEEAALSQVVRRFFLSSQGDDAAYKLACLALDRHDFVGASRLLSKIVESYPDPSVPAADIWLRLAVASAHMQDRQAAERSLGQFTSAGGPRPSAEVVDAVMADVTSAAAASLTASEASSDRHFALGNASRSGHMPSLPAAVTSRTLSELWVRELPLALAMPAANAGGVQVWAGGMMPGMGGGFGGRVVRNNDPNNSPPVSREELVARWREFAWRPTGRLLFDGGRVYLKTPDRLECYSATSLSDQPLWHSATENRYQLDMMSQQFAMLAMSAGVQLPAAMQARPKTPAEVLLFGDRVHQSAAIDGGVIYSLEGKPDPGQAPPNTAPGRRPFQWGANQRRSRSNWLTAYQAFGGRALWTRSASEDDAESSADVGFLSAPTPAGSLLLAPLTDGGTVWLAALDRATGKTAWRTYLCDEPPGGASPWAETMLAVDGREAYVTAGCGVVFAVDAASGSIRWAVRYDRDGKPNAWQQQMYGGRGNNIAIELNGWDDDVAIPSGRALIVLSSDSDKLLALDRRTGELLWESPRTSPLGSVASYCLGTLGRGLFVAGKNVVRRYDIVSGRLIWEKEIENSFGRGCVTANALYLPVRDSILKLDPEKGRDLSQVGVALTNDEPVGNLFSDGDKLWVVGAARVYAMTTLEHRLEMLAEKIAAGDAEAQLSRMRLYFKQNRLELALDDLRSAYGRFKQSLAPDEAALRLLVAMQDLKLPQSQPLIALKLLTDEFGAGAAPKLSRDALTRLGDAVISSVNAIRQQKTPGGASAVLAAAPLFIEDYLLMAATHAVDSAATKEDAASLITALERGPAEAQLVSIRAAARLAPDDAKSPLAKLLAGGDDRVRLAAARALANLEERNGVLETLVLLLDSPSAKVRSRSYQTLMALSGEQIAFLPDAKAADRAAGARAWKDWAESRGAAAKWKLPLSDQSVPLGRFVFVSASPAAVTEMDLEHKQRWQSRLPGPAWGCQGLPNGHRLVALYTSSTVIEYDADGKEVWRKDRLPGPPFSVQRLDSGSTLIACSTASRLVEIAPDGTTTSIPIDGHPISAQRLDNGNTLVALQRTPAVVEVDRQGKTVATITTPGPPSHAVRLENGNTLVTLVQQRQVVEFDATGTNIVWRTQVPLANPTAAQRLASGATLVADYQGVREIDASGANVLWQQRLQQVTGLSSF